MGRIGHGYGSEWQLLRYLGRHRGELDRRVRRVVGASTIRWLDFPPAHGRESERWQDAEWKGLDFLLKAHPARKRWLEDWPQTGNVPNWDAVAEITVRGKKEWLLVEAKAHIHELKSDCKAAASPSLAKIELELSRTKDSLGVPKSANWLRCYYQYANRRAVLSFLNQHGVPAHLLFIYFVGDWIKTGRRCPTSKAGWATALRAQQAHIKLPRTHALRGHIHELFLNVRTT